MLVYTDFKVSASEHYLMSCVVVLWVCVWTRQAWFSVKGSIAMPGCVQPQGRIWNSECVLWNPHRNSRNKSCFSDAELHIFQQFSLFICLSMLIFHQRRLSTQTFVRHTRLLCWKTFSPILFSHFLVAIEIRLAGKYQPPWPCKGHLFC